MERVRVALPSDPYDVVVGRDIVKGVLEVPRSAETSVVITDETVDVLFGELVQDLLIGSTAVKRLVVPPGEGSKALSVVESLLSSMADLQVHRGDVVIALGGGVITDLGGFTASIYMRGLPLIHLPTTLLGQVDAAIGGKTGVNLAEGKNLVGSFYQPREVICDVGFLDTLPEREFTSGLAEVIKYALCFDPQLVRLLQDHELDIKHKDPLRMEQMIVRCVQLKAEIVASDERDFQRRLTLNYGHTLGHALEAVFGYRHLSHGEAISIGMVCASLIAKGLGMIDESQAVLHSELLSSFGLPVRKDFPIDDALRFIAMDKKSSDGVRWILLGSDGPEVVSGVDESLLMTALVAVGGTR